MAVLTRPVRRTAQPSGPAAIDWGNPLTRDLVAVQHVAGGVWLSRRGVSPIAITVGTPVRTPNPKGVAIQHPAFFSYSLSEISDASVTGYAGPVTLLSVFVPDTTTNLTEPAFFGGGFGHRIQATYASTPGKIGAVFRGLSPIGGTNTLSNLSVPAVVISRSIPAVEQAVWVNGVKDPSTSSGTHDALPAANMGLAAARPGLMLNAFFKRALSDAEIAQLSANPWQLFDPTHQRVAYDVGTGAPPDTTAPTLTLPTGADTGSTTATGTITTDEGSGTAYAIVSVLATAPSVAQIQAGQNSLGAAAEWSGSQVVTTTGVKTFNSMGLMPATVHYYHFQHRDAAGNDSTVSSSTMFTTDAVDATAPTLSSPTATALSNALIAAGVTTDEANGTLYVVATTSATPPSAAQIRAGQDHTGASAVFADDQVVASTGAKTFNVTGLTQLTLYYLYFHHQDAAGNNSTVSSASATTFRNGATAQSVIDDTAAVGGNPAGVLYALALTKSADDWMAYREISPPDPAGGVLTANPNGSFTYVGPEPADWVIQPEVNGTDDAGGQITVALYQTIEEDATPPTLTNPTGAALGSTGAAGSVSTNEASGTLYWLTNTSAMATDAAIKAASSQPVTTTGVQSVTSSGLTPSTLYYNHFLHRDAAGNDSTRSTSASFTTAASGGAVGGSRPGEKTMHSCMKPAMYPAMNKS